MTVNKGPEFDFHNIIPVEMHITPLEQAQLEHDEWAARCPGTALECALAGRSEERRAWIREGVERSLEERLTLAKAYAGASKVKRKAPKRRCDAERPANTPAPDRRTVEDFVAMVRRKVEAMAKLEPGSIEWRRARASASNYSMAARKRARQDGLPMPDMPTIPHLGDFIQLPTRPRLPGTPEQEAKREQWRKQGAAKRARRAAKRKLGDL